MSKASHGSRGATRCLWSALSPAPAQTGVEHGLLGHTYGMVQGLLSGRVRAEEPHEDDAGVHELVPEWYPFALFIVGPPLLKPNRRKKGTLIIKGLLRNQDEQMPGGDGGVHRAESATGKP